jgi:15-cis-phytoene synthase
MASQPTPSEPRMQAAADIAHCRALLRTGSYTFFAASLLLPRVVREPASALYAFCRLADDGVDVSADAAGALRTLHDRLEAAYAGRPQAHPADRALARVVARFAIPPELPGALLEGFAWDLAGRRYETLEELEEYSARVAGSVGAMMALLMGVRTPDGMARACDLGVAMQLSNIARDVGEDARMGRLYLPQQWLREAGVDPDAWLAEPVFSDAIASVVQRLLLAADRLYRRVDAGVAQLPLSCRPGINAARFLYAAIGHAVRQQGLDSVSCRARVAPARKAVLLAKSLLHLRPAWPDRPEPALASTQFLLDACAPLASRQRQGDAAQPPWWDMVGRWVRVLDIFERLERQERLRNAPGTVWAP